VVDLGGACGEWGLVLQKSSRRPVDYCVVESPDLAGRLAADPFFDWFRCVTEIPSGFDVFLSSGTLQYLDDPYGPLEVAFERAREFVVLARNGFCDREVFRVHRSRLGDNGAGAELPPGFDPDLPVAYPHRTVSRERILAMAERAGWRLLERRASASGVLPWRGRVFGEDLLFGRAGPGER
jgi:putative methyltransferase (TIGR04325 family)